MKLYCKTKVVGTTYRPVPWGDMKDRFDKEGEYPLLLVREPTNEYDSNAVMVCFGELHIGYISKEWAIGLARVMDGGTPARAVVKEITGGRTPDMNHGCNIEVWLDDE